MGLGSERHDLHSYETHDAQWIGFRQPVLRAARERLGRDGRRHARGEPGRGLGGERVLDRAVLAHRSRRRARHPPVRRVEASGRASKLAVDEYYGYIFENSVPGLPERAAAEGLTPLEYMRRYGAFEISTRRRAAPRGARCRAERARGSGRGPFGRVYTARAEAAVVRTSCRWPTPDPDAEGRRPVGVRDRRRGAARLPDAERPARVLLAHARRVGLARSTRCRPTSRATSIPTEPRRRTRCASSRPSGCRCRSTRAAPTRSGSTRSRTPTRSGSTRGTRRGSASRTGDLVRVETRDRPLRRQGLGDRGHPARESSPAAITWDAGSSDEPDAASAQTDGDGGARRATAAQLDAAPRSGASSPYRVERSRHARGSGGPTSACTRTSRSRCIPIRSRACTAGTRRCASRRPRPAIATATSSSTPRSRAASTRSGSRARVRRRATRRTARGGRTGCCVRSSRRGRSTGCRDRPVGPAVVPEYGALPRPRRARRAAVPRAAADRRRARPRGAARARRHTDLFVFQLQPYASVYLGAEGMLGGEARDRIAGFWRALGASPPSEPDHLATMLALLRRSGEREAGPASRRGLAPGRPRPSLGAPGVLAAGMAGDARTEGPPFYRHGPRC